MDDIKNLPAPSCLSQFNAVAVLDALGIKHDKMPEAPALRFRYEETVNEFIQHGMKALPARTQAQSFVTDFVQVRLELIKKYEREFFKRNRNADSTPHEHDALMIAAICEQTLESVDSPKTGTRHAETIHGMDASRIMIAHAIWEQVTHYYDDSGGYETASSPDSDDEEDFEDAPQAIVESAYVFDESQIEAEGQKYLDAANDNDQGGIMIESLFLIHICGMEQLRDVEAKYSTYDKADLKSIRENTFAVIMRFASEETRIGRDLLKWVGELERRIELTLNPRALTAPALTPA